jgi:hypothetical protein
MSAPTAAGIREIIITFTWSVPRGVAGYTKAHASAWQDASRSSRILNSLQIVMICRSGAITLLRSGGRSKHCRQDLIVPSLLRLGHLPFLPFLIFLKSSILPMICSHQCTSPSKLRLLLQRVVLVLWEVLVRLPGRTYGSPGLHSGQSISIEQRSRQSEALCHI